MKTRSGSKRQPSKRFAISPDKTNKSQIKSKRFKRSLPSDLSETSDEDVSFQSKTKSAQRRRLPSGSSSDSSDSSEKIGNFNAKTKNIKRKRLSSDSSSVASQKSENSIKVKNRYKRLLKYSSESSSDKSDASEVENNSSCTSEDTDVSNRITRSSKKKRLSKNFSSSSGESDTDESQSNNSSCSAEESDVSARKTKKSKRIRFLRNTTNSSDDESEQLDVSGLLKYKLKKLRWAVSYNNAKQVETIIDVNYVKLNSPEFGNLLWRALENKNVKIIDMLVRAGVDVNVRGTGDDRENTLLHAVVSKATTVEFEQLVLLLIEYGADIEEVDGNGNTILHCAIESGSFLLIEKLLDLGADIDAVNYLNQNILYVAAKSPRAEKLLPLLVQYNVPDLETRNRRAMTALGYLVTISGDLAAMKALLDLKVPINEKNDRNSTLLDYAVADRKSFEIVKLLLEYGADPSKKRQDGNFYLCLACSIKNCSMAALLIKNGARIHVCNDNGQYPIHEACKYGSLQNIALLLFLGANVNNVDNRGYTPFTLMSTYYLHDASKIMIKHFAILTSKNIQVNQNDLLQVRTHPSMNEFYEKCLDELTNMKTLKIYNNVTAYSILTQSVLKLTQLIRNKDFVKNYYQNLMNILTVFPIYSKSIEKLFNVALKVRKAMISLTDALDEATNFILPEEIWEIITFYSCCHRLVDFYV